jgi:hypothetical protein
MHPEFCAPTPLNRFPYIDLSNMLMSFGNAGFSTEYMKQKLCQHCGIDTLKYHPSKKARTVPSKWYLRNDSISTFASWHDIFLKYSRHVYSFTDWGINSNTSHACNGAKERMKKQNTHYAEYKAPGILVWADRPDSRTEQERPRSRSLNGSCNSRCPPHWRDPERLWWRPKPHIGSAWIRKWSRTGQNGGVLHGGKSKLASQSIQVGCLFTETRREAVGIVSSCYLLAFVSQIKE